MTRLTPWFELINAILVIFLQRKLEKTLLNFILKTLYFILFFKPTVK